MATVRTRQALLTALLVTGVVAVAAQAAPTASDARRCQGSELRGRVGQWSGAAGTIVLSVRLRNVSQNACTTSGFPSLALRRGPNTIPSRVRHGGVAFLKRPVKKVTIPPGGVATVLVAYSDVPTGNERRCPTATTLLVQPPGAGEAVRVRTTITACNRGLLSTSPILAGAVALG